MTKAKTETNTYDGSFLDALASLDFKLSVSGSGMFLQLAHLRVFQIYLTKEVSWIPLVVILRFFLTKGGQLDPPVGNATFLEMQKFRNVVTEIL